MSTPSPFLIPGTGPGDYYTGLTRSVILPETLTITIKAIVQNDWHALVTFRFMSSFTLVKRLMIMSQINYHSDTHVMSVMHYVVDVRVNAI